MKEYLQATEYFDYNSKIIQTAIDNLELDGLTDKEKIVKIFYFVRDSIRYSVHVNYFNPEIFKASYTLKEKVSFCIPKAITLCSLARAINIPSRIHLVDLRNHRLSEKLIEAWGGSNIMASHTYSELFLNNKWVKATPAIDIKTSSKHNFIPVEFDGINDALLHPKDINGHLHAEYIKDHGSFADLPLKFIHNLFNETYGPITPKRIKEMITNQVPTF